MTTFIQYIKKNNTENTELYKLYLCDTIDKLPNKICSSKIIYEIIKNDIKYSYFKTKIFRETFMEYFKLKLNGSLYSEAFSASTDIPIR